MLCLAALWNTDFCTKKIAAFKYTDLVLICFQSTF